MQWGEMFSVVSTSHCQLLVQEQLLKGVVFLKVKGIAFLYNWNFVLFRKRIWDMGSFLSKIDVEMLS